MNKFPQDFQHTLAGFGGDPSKDRAQHRASIRKTPVILVHGNAGHATHPQWGMETMKNFLVDAGYQDVEVWAMSYLGENNSSTFLGTVHRDHIGAFRSFVDQVRAYLGVDKLDFIAHSLGCGMVNGYLRGLQADGRFDNADQRYHVLGSFISLAGATYGLGRQAKGDFESGGTFDIASHRFNGVADDTPMGQDDPEKQVSPAAPPQWKEVTPLDNSQCRYAALIAKNDFVDQQNPDTGRRTGADLNKRYDLGFSIQGHEKIIKSQTVFDDFKSLLNRDPPQPPAFITVDKASGSYGANLQVRVAVAPADMPVTCTASRLTRQFQNGAMVDQIVASSVLTLANGESVTLAQDGAWDVVFSATNAEPLQRTYGVNVALPELTVAPPDGTRYTSRLGVTVAASKGTSYISLDKTHWNALSNIILRDTSTLYFMAIDADGLPSPMARATYERQAPESITATPAEHYVAHHVDVNGFLALGQQFGYSAQVTLYRVGDQWVLDPETPEAVKASHRQAAADTPASISADRPSGNYAAGFDATIAAASALGADATVYYTEDGSDPSDARNPNRRSFAGSKTFSIARDGDHAICCYAAGRDGDGLVHAFAWHVGEGS